MKTINIFHKYNKRKVMEKVTSQENHGWTRRERERKEIEIEREKRSCVMHP